VSPSDAAADPGWRIRRATLADAAQVGAVAGIAWRATYAGIIEAGHIERFLAGAYSEASVRRRIATSDRFDVAVSVAPEEIVGFAEWAVRERVAELIATYVLPTWQRRGIGRAFHELALDSYRRRVDHVSLHVVRDNAGARAFYRQMGYGDERPETFELFGAQIPELRMEQRLDGGPSD
jgi:ribosomal protein S18 acetylase RimI-like enzyme